MTRKIFIFIAFALTAAAARGQNLETYKISLAQTSVDGARITVTEAWGAASVINSIPAGSPDRIIDCYRVEIFFDTSSNARKLAYDTYAQFRELFPNIPADEKNDIGYSSPKYSVRVGYFLTHEEAIAMCGRLKPHFEKAYPRAERIELSKFAERAFPILSDEAILPEVLVE